MERIFIDVSRPFIMADSTTYGLMVVVIAEEMESKRLYSFSTSEPTAALVEAASNMRIRITGDI